MSCGANIGGLMGWLFRKGSKAQHLIEIRQSMGKMINSLVFRQNS